MWIRIISLKIFEHFKILNTHYSQTALQLYQIMLQGKILNFNK